MTVDSLDFCPGLQDYGGRDESSNSHLLCWTFSSAWFLLQIICHQKLPSYTHTHTHTHKHILSLYALPSRGKITGHLCSKLLLYLYIICLVLPESHNNPMSWVYYFLPFEWQGNWHRDSRWQRWDWISPLLTSKPWVFREIDYMWFPRDICGLAWSGKVYGGQGNWAKPWHLYRIRMAGKKGLRGLG